MKIVAGIQCYNEEDFIEESITSLYLFCDTIVVTEGCWDSGMQATKSKRSTDNTIEIIKSIPDPENKIKLFHYNGRKQTDHRHFTLEKSKQYDPDWYLNGDGDEIFHEDEIDTLLESFTNETYAVNPTHKLFWNGLKYYELWKPAGRFFKFKGLDLNKITASRNCCNKIEYHGTNIYDRSTTPLDMYIYHPSYSKKSDRQKFKIQHRTIDNKIKFPHYIDKNLMFRGGIDQRDWIDNLHIHDSRKLPNTLQHHVSHETGIKFDEFIESL